MANEFDEVLDQESAGTLPPLSSGLEKGEFDDVLDTEVTQQRDYVRNVIDIASKDNPEAAAERVRLSQSTGLPPDVVARNQQELKRREIARAIDLQRMMRDSPVLFRQMTDPTFTAAAIDDLDTLRQIEKSFTNIANYAKSGELASDAGGAAKSLALGATVGVGKMIFDVFGAATDLVGLDYLSGGYRTMSNNAREAMDAYGLQADTSTGRAVKSGLESAGQNLALLPLGLERGLFQTAEAAGAAVAGAMSVGVGADSYQRARGEGVGRLNSALYGLNDAGVEFLMEKIPAGQLFKGIELDNSLLKLFAQQTVTEGWTEQVTTLAQDFNEWMALHPEKSTAEFLAERPEAAYQTFIATLIGTGVQTTAIAGINKLVQKASDQALVYEQDRLKRQLQLAGMSALRERSPEQFRANMEQVVANAPDGAPTEIHVDAEVLNQLGPEMQALLPETVRAQIPEALAMNATVPISMADVLTIAPGTELEQILNDNARVGSPEAPSRVEAEKAAEFIQQDAERVLQQAQDQSVWQSEVDTVQQTIKGQLDQAGRFTSDVNEGYARLQSQFFSVMASRFGITPTEMYQRFSVKVAGQMGQGEVLNAGADQIQTPEFKNWFGDSKVVDAEGRPLVVYHGTTEDITVFDAFRRGENTGAESASMGFFFTDDTVSAESYANYAATNGRVLALVREAEKAEAKGDWDTYDAKVQEYEALDASFNDPQNRLAGQNVVPVYLAMKNPLRVDAKGENAVGFDIAAAVKQAVRGKYDGLIIENLDDAVGLVDRVATHYVAFNPTQIKSATGNQGTFDPNDPNILRQSARGTFNPQTLLISLGPQSDLSTFLHESGHFFLEVMADLAAQPDAPAQVREDMDKVLAWFGVPDLATWNTYTLDQKRPHHERWAESFEQYLLEGKAPSAELQPLFRRFRAWLVNVYKSLTDFMRGRNLEVNDEIRQVFDRMLATDAEIAQAEEVAGLLPDFDGTNEAIERLQARKMRDLKWTLNARSKFLKQFTREAREARKLILQEVLAEFDQRPDAIAARAIRKVRNKEGAERDAKLEGIAAAQGYGSVQEMDVAVQALGPVNEAVEAEVDRRMTERYGELSTPEALEKAANEAVYNEAHIRSLATELKTQQEALSERQSTGRVSATGRPITVNALVAAAKQFAEDITSRRRVRDLKSAAQQHRAATARATKRWEQATRKGETKDAIQAQKDRLLNAQAAKTLLEAQTEVEKTIGYLRKFNKDSIRQKLPPEYLDQIDKLLERVDLRASVSGKQIDKRASLKAWIESQNELGIDPIIPENLLEDIRLTSYKMMTVEEIRGLHDTIRNIEHLGKLKSKLLKAKDKREFDAAATAWADNIRANGGEAVVRLEPDGRLTRLFKGFWAEHRKLNSLVRQMDGGQDGGIGFRLLIASMNEQGTQEDVALEKAAAALGPIFAPVDALPGGLSGGQVYIPEISASLSRAARLAIALNWGNTQNRQRVMDGDGWTQAQVEAVLATLTPTELEFVNKVWEHLDSYWPEIKAKQQRVSGLVEEKVAAEPFAIKIADGTIVEMRGGYYPIKYDPDRSVRAQVNDAKQAAMDMLRGAMLRPTTRRGHTKARVDEVYGRPIRKDLAPITQHITQVVHDLAWHEWAIDANRLLADKRIAAAIREHYGPETHRAMTDAVEAIVTGDVGKQTDVDKILLLIRSNVTRSIMGVSATTALLQPFGLTQSMARIGVTPVLKGAWRWAGDAVKMESSLEWIHNKSDFMRLRAKTFNRDLREINQQIQGRWKVTQVMDAVLFAPMQKMQMIADVPTWIGAYEKALSEGQTEELAVAIADEAVLSSQGGGSIKDLSDVQRNHPFLTQFYSYFNATLQLVAESTALTNWKNPRAVAGWVGDMALLAMIPAILPALITYALKGGGEDDEPEDWAKRIAGWQASYLLGMFVGLRELPAIWGPFDYQGPPAGKLINDGKRLVQQANQGEIDDPAVLAAISLIGTVLGLPTTQVIRSYKGWKAWDEGDAPASSILFGPPPKD